MLKKYITCILIVLLCFSLLTPYAMAQDSTVIVIPEPQHPGVILILKPNGTIQDKIYLNPINPVDNPSTQEESTPQTKEEVINEPIAETPQEINNDLIKEIFDLINKEREKANLNKIEYNFELQSAADLRAKEASEKFAHTRPNGETCYTAFNVDYNVAGENLILADLEIADAANLVKTWMESEGHKANILLPEFTSTAIGIYLKDNVLYASELFIG